MTLTGWMKALTDHENIIGVYNVDIIDAEDPDDQ